MSGYELAKTGVKVMAGGFAILASSITAKAVMKELNEEFDSLGAIVRKKASDDSDDISDEEVLA